MCTQTIKVRLTVCGRIADWRHRALLPVPPPSLRATDLRREHGDERSLHDRSAGHPYRAESWVPMAPARQNANRDGYRLTACHPIFSRYRVTRFHIMRESSAGTNRGLTWGAAGLWRTTRLRASPATELRTIRV